MFFTVCGATPEQACVIERTQREAVVRPMPGPVLVQANHHVAGRFARNNADILEAESEEDVFSLAGSSQRAETLTSALAEIPVSCSLETVANALNRAPVLNQDACQQMVFCPGRGELTVWRKAEG